MEATIGLPDPNKLPAPLNLLSAHELELLLWYVDGVPMRLMAAWRGRTERSIARKLSLLRRTISGHPHATMRRIKGRPVKRVRNIYPSITRDKLNGAGS